MHWFTVYSFIVICTQLYAYIHSYTCIHSSEEPKRVGLLSFTDMISHLRILVTLPSTATDHTWQLEILQFLALHSFWNVTEVSTDLKHVSDLVNKMQCLTCLLNLSKCLDLQWFLNEMQCKICVSKPDLYLQAFW